MTPWQVFALLGGVALLATVIGLAGMIRAASLADCDCEGRDTEEPLFAEGWMADFETMHPAVLASNWETAPGGPSADLIDCWGLWPDAPAFTLPGEDEAA